MRGYRVNLLASAACAVAFVVSVIGGEFVGAACLLLTMGANAFLARRLMPEEDRLYWHWFRRRLVYELTFGMVGLRIGTHLSWAKYRYYWMLFNVRGRR